MSTTTRAPHADSALLRCVARACRQQTLLVTLSGDAPLITRQHLVVHQCTAEQVDHLHDAEAFDSAAAVGVLEYLPEAEGNALIDRLWRRLVTGGRLVVSVPNEGALGDSGQTRFFSARSLRQLLRERGRPKLISNQPYRWLLMYVDKNGKRSGGTPASRVARYDVMSRLCRGRVIELGCGVGELTALISRRGLTAMGVDINGAKIASAQRRYPEVRFEQCDIRELHTSDERFDTVVLAEVLEHVAEGAGAAMLDAARHLLQPGGRLVVSVPNEHCIPHPNHIRTFSRGTLHQLLRPFGRPRLVTDQPYKWLLMYVDVARPAGPLPRGLPRDS